MEGINKYGECVILPLDLMVDITGTLNDDEVGRLFTGILYYIGTGNDPDFEGAESYFWNILKRIINER